MSYQPRHKVARPFTAGRRAMGVVMASSATVGTGLATASHAKAETPWNVWDRVATCESGNNWSINTGNGFYGGLQFTKQTWLGFGGGQYASSAQYATREQQILIAQKTLAVQGPGAWPVCSKRAGLTRANGLAVQVGGGGGGPAPAPKPQPPTSRSDNRALVIDGIVGPLTTRSTQHWLGIRQDGANYLGARTVIALQARLGVNQDGIIGPITTAAMQRYLGIPRDGASHFNARTVMALQQYLNSKGM
ncbi:transglycosylase family protein [Flexivirga meconopsidis]|uniref:transglycosylase family protein n=1 Tax=Flexivirga meconopsidis TaxID=2977121 RepID=UPI002448D3E7|nr:transglycosylase family protein [Flexivirga meconopsidis]